MKELIFYVIPYIMTPGSKVHESEKLLEATLNEDEGAVASALELIHEECTSSLKYNDD